MSVCDYIFDIPLQGSPVLLNFPNCIRNPIVQAANYGLTSFSAKLQGIPKVTGIVLILPLTPPLRVSSIYKDGKVSITTTPPLPSGVILTTFNTGQNSFLIELSSTGRIVVFYEIHYLNGGNRVKITLGTKMKSLGTSFVVPELGILPSILANIEPTFDGKQVCVLTFRVSGQNSRRDYRQYCVNFASVMRFVDGACTLAAKLETFNLGENFVQYMTVRYILSGLLKEQPFGVFDVQLLRRRYNQAFLKVVAQSEYKVFLSFLTANQSFPTYFKK